MTDKEAIIIRNLHKICHPLHILHVKLIMNCYSLLDINESKIKTRCKSALA